MTLAHQPFISTNGLTLYLDAASPRSYPGSGSVWTDRSHFGNNGTITGAAFGTEGLGSFLLDGIDDYIDIPDSGIDITSAFSFSCWVKKEEATLDNDVVVAIYDDANNYFRLAADTSLQKWSVSHNDAGSSVTNATYSDFTLSQWANITYTYDGTTGRFYYNGIEVSAGSDTAYSVGSTYQYIIGKNPDSNADTYFKGKIGHICAYNRRLSADEVFKNFTGLKPRYTLTGGTAPTFTPAKVSGAVAVWEPVDSLVEAGSRDFVGTNSEYFTRASEATFVCGDVAMWSASWFKVNDGATRTPGLRKWDASGGSREWGIYCLVGAVKGLFSSNGSTITELSAGGGTAPTGTDVFCIIYHDPVANEVGISVDGGSFVTTAFSGGIYSGTSNMSLGAYHTTGQYMDGLIYQASFGKPSTSDMATLAATIRDSLYNNGQGLEWDEITSAQRTNWGLTAGNGVFYPLNEESGDALDAVNGLDLTDTNTVGIGASLRSKAIDWSSNRNHGTPSGVSLADLYDSDLPSALSGGASAWSAVFDGTDDYIDCGDSAVFTNPSGFSVSFWYKGTEAGSKGIVSKYATSNLEWVIGTTTSGVGGCVQMICYDQSATAYIGRYTGTTSINDGSWHHVTCTYNGGTTPAAIKIYIDDVQADDTNSSSGTFVAIEDKSEALKFATSPGYGADAKLSGNIADARIYSDELTAAEVSTLYAGGDHTDNLVFQMDFREGPGAGYADGDVIGYVPDSADGNELKQATAANRPAIDSSSYVKPVLVFGGTDDVLTAGDAANIDAIGTGDFTVLAWVKIPANTGNSDSIVSKIGGSTSSDAGWIIAVNYNTDDGLILARICDGTTTVVSTADGSAIDDGAWHHVAVVFDRSASMTRYLDGVTTGSADTISTASGSIANARELMVGARDRTTGDDLYLDGEVGTVAIYNRVLTEAEINKIMTETDPNA